ncbi:hypothetical protein H2204_010081 [Knufia peltigerae]|uniref:Nephrocystin 3-like N-terminal domain-containing protein n=1 Tax=Knufia peltigerae TaxID=1002370 RepID=A0AA39CT37_9EURO|nr:hypothetical protein H2204_010081 [Knufia peltigerae]
MPWTYLKEIWPAVVGVCFLGTPHRGSATASLGKIAFQISRMAYTQPNIDLLRTLERNSAVLERISDGFAAILVDGQIQVQWFREILPTKGVMIVEPYSSVIGNGREVVRDIPANHRNMTRFASSSDIGFTRILAVLRRWLSDPLSLSLRETEFRSATIQDSFRGTCDWILSETVPFYQWLRAKHRNSTFWIQGKPGSGNSTAMKYAMQHMRTKSLLQQSSPRDWLISGFFVYDRGWEIQKSTRGLLFQLLHSLLTKRPELARYVLPIYVNEVSVKNPNPNGQGVFDELNLARLDPNSKSAITQERQRWTVDRFQAALLAIIRQTTLPLNLCLFIDALDEHSGSRVEMLKLLVNLVASSDPKVVQVKLCLASRPDTQFIDWLQDHSGFKIHDHTSGDMMLYARGRIRMELSLRHVEEKTEFVGVILARISRLAQGVFIRVRLVMDELVQGIQEGDNVEELNDILEDIPVELEDICTRAVLRMGPEKAGEDESKV